MFMIDQCGDAYTKVDSPGLGTTLDEQQDRLKVILAMAWVSVGALILEVLLVIPVFVYLRHRARNSSHAGYIGPGQRQQQLNAIDD